MAGMTTRLMELKARIFCDGIRIDDELWPELTDYPAGAALIAFTLN